MRSAVLLTVVLACALAGCGAQERSAEVEMRKTVSTGAAPPPTVPAPPADENDAAPQVPRAAAPAVEPAATGSTGGAPAAAPPATPESDPGGASADPPGPGGAGDEQPLLQPARFTIAAGDVRPASVAVAPFLGVALEVVNADGVARRVALVGTDVAFVVAPGGTVVQALPGLGAAMYTVSVDGGTMAASIVAGDAGGA